VRKLRARRVHGLVWPLMTTSSGAKFGKTESGAIWLDPARTSSFKFYQFWLNTDDRDVIRYLKFFTFMTRDEIEWLAKETAERADQREAQRALARAVTALVHGDDQVQRAERAAKVLFGGSFEDVAIEDLLTAFEDAPSTEIDLAEDGIAVVDLLARVKLASSKSEAVRLLKGGGVYVNNDRVADEKARLTAVDALGGELFVLRKGRKDQHIVRLRRV
jgi:tyrosyl-tRNA synthetase